MGRVIIVQQIKTVWSKASRGGEGAVRRNAVPEAMKTPFYQTQAADLTLLHHKLHYYQGNDFQTPQEDTVVHPAARPMTIGCVTIDQYQDGVTARFIYDRSCGGMPARHNMPEAFVLTLNQWGRIIYNGKFVNGYESEYWYERMVVNVGVFDPPSDSVFTRSAPTLRYAAIARLY